jgi:hypothetical protein
VAKTAPHIPTCNGNLVFWFACLSARIKSCGTAVRTLQEPIKWLGATKKLTGLIQGRWCSTHTFDQTVAGFMQTASARGTWSVASKGDVVFSREFIKPSGQPLATGETAKAIDPRGSRFLQIEIAADQELGTLSYCKRQLPWQ